MHTSNGVIALNRLSTDFFIKKFCKNFIFLYNATGNETTKLISMHAYSVYFPPWNIFVQQPLIATCKGLNQCSTRSMKSCHHYFLQYFGKCTGYRFFNNSFTDAFKEDHSACHLSTLHKLHEPFVWTVWFINNSPILLWYSASKIFYSSYVWKYKYETSTHFIRPINKQRLKY